MTIKCPQCSHNNSDDTEFCEQCGAQLPSPVAVATGAAVGSGVIAGSAPSAPPMPTGASSQLICPSCNAPLTMGDEFCFNCGNDVRALTGPQPIVPTAPQPGQLNDDAINKALADLDKKVEVADTDDAALAPAPPPAPTPVVAAVSAPVVASAPAPVPAPILASAPAANAFSAPVVPAAAPPVPAAAPGSFTLHIAGPYGDEVIEWSGREFLLGRNDPKTRIFPDVNLDDSAASRRHLAIWKETSDGLYYAQDLESANGTILNGRDLKPGEPTELHHGDVLKIGTRYTIQVRIG